VLSRALVNIVGFRRSAAQLLAQLRQEQGYSVIDLRFGRRGSRPLRHFRSAQADEFVAIFVNELIKRQIRHAPSVAQA
jgi:hypothetical protein